MKTSKQILFVIILLFVRTTPLFAHPIVYVPEWFPITLIIIGLILYIVILKLMWKSKFLRYLILLIHLMPLVGYIIDNIYTDIHKAKEIEKKEKEQKNITYTLKQINKSWGQISDTNKVISIIKSLDKKYITHPEIKEKISILYLALYVKDPIKHKNYKIKSYKINRNTCSLTKNLLKRIAIEDESIYLELFSKIKQETPTKELYNCIPYQKLFFVKKLLNENKINVLLNFLDKEQEDRKMLLSLLPSIKKIKDEELQKKMILLLLKNYNTTEEFDSFTDKISSILDDIPIYEVLYDTKYFNDYIEIIHTKFKEKKGILKRDASSFIVREHSKKNFLKLQSLLDKNNSLIQEIPTYIQEHFIAESLKDNASEKYILFEKDLKYINGGEELSYQTSPYILYLEDKRVDASLSNYYGYIRYRFPIQDKGKKITIKYIDNEEIETLTKSERFKESGFQKYWILDLKREGKSASSVNQLLLTY